MSAILLDITKNHYMSEAVHSNYQIEGSRNKSLARRFLVWTRFHRRQMSWWYSPSLHHYPKSQRRGELSPCWVIVAAFRVCTCHNFLSDSVADNRLGWLGTNRPGPRVRAVDQHNTDTHQDTEVSTPLSSHYLFLFGKKKWKVPIYSALKVICSLILSLKVWHMSLLSLVKFTVW